MYVCSSWASFGIGLRIEDETDDASAIDKAATRASLYMYYKLEGNYDEAEKYFQKAYLSDLNDPLIYHHYLLAAYVGGKKEKAFNNLIRNKSNNIHKIHKI